MASSTGIEIIDDQFKCVVLSGNAKSPRLKTAFSVSLAPSDEEENGEGKAQRLEKILKENNVPLSNVVLALDGRQVFSREVVIPFLRSEQIQKTIKFEAEEFMPAAAVESMIIDHYKVAEIDGKSRILVCGIQKSEIAEIIDFCKKADFSPRMLDLDSACLANVGYMAGIFEPPEIEEEEQDENKKQHTTYVAIDVSEDITRLALVEDGRLRRTRTFKVTVSAENPEPQAIGKITREIRRTEASCSLRAPLSVAYVTGSAYSIALETRLGVALGTEVKSLNLQSITRSENQEEILKLQKAGSVALGAALKGMGIDNIEFDFRKEEFAFQKTFDYLKSGLACTACLGFFLAFLLAYSFNLRLSQYNYAVRTIRDNANKTYRKLLPGDTMPSYDTPADRILTAFNNTLEKRKSGQLTDKAPTVIPALDIFKDYGDAVAQAKVDMRLLEIKIDQNSVRVRGVVSEASKAENIKRAISRGAKYLDLDSSTVEDVKGETVLNQRLKIKESK